MRKNEVENMVEGAAEITYTPQAIAAHQVAVYVMCGGGFLGRLAAEQPADFYIDLRVGKLPYPKRDISRAVKVLAGLAQRAGLNPNKMPTLPDWHSSRVW